jgi:hypothetical protein
MLRRALFGLFWFGVLWMALAVIGGGIADSLAPAHSSATASQVQGGEPRKPGSGEAARGFHARYGTIVLASAALLALGGTLAGILPGTKR